MTNVAHYEKMRYPLYSLMLSRYLEPDSGVLYCNDKLGQFAFGRLIKEDKGLKREGFRLLSFREITVWAYELKKTGGGFGVHAKTVARALETMADRKSENLMKRSVLSRVILLVCDVISNLFSGYGLKSTTTLARELSKFLQQSDTKEPVKAQAPPSGKNVKRVKLGRKSTNAKMTALMTYALQLSDPHRKANFPVIWKDIVSIEPENVSDSMDPTTSLVGLMIYCSLEDKGYLMDHINAFLGGEEIDFNIETCIAVAVDAYTHCNKAVVEKLTVWLMKQKTFNAALMMEIFKIYRQKDKQDESFDFYPLLQLVKLYQEKDWTGELSVNDPSLVDAITILLRKTSNMEDHNITQIAGWMIEQNDFMLCDLLSWLRVYKDKEKQPDMIGKVMDYPVRDFLLGKIKERSAWVEAVKADKDMWPYIEGCTAWSKRT